MKAKKFTPGLFAVLLFCSCAGKIRLWVDYESFPEPERSFLASVLAGKELAKRGLIPCDDPGPGVMTVVYRALWITWAESDTDSPQFTAGGGFLPLSRTCMVFQALPWEGNTGLDEAPGVSLPRSREVSPNSSIIPLGDLGPPYVSRRVNGLDAADPAYPLVLLGGAEFAREGSLNESESKRLREKINALSEMIMARRRAGNSRIPASSAVPAPRYEERPRFYRIAAGGDVVLERGVPDILFKEGPGAVMGGTEVLAGAADLALLNLEGAVTRRGEPAEKTYAFRFDPAVVRVLADFGFDAVLAANNHAFDYGLTGFLDTLSHLESLGLYALGVGRDINAAAAPFVTGSEEFPVRVFGLASFGRERSGWDGLDYAADDALPGMLHAGKRGAELIRAQLAANNNRGLEIVVFHGGKEYTDYPDEDTRTLYTELVEAGADLVIGTHPHVEQGFEWVKGKPVFWSLGDYIFDDMADTPGGDKGIFIVLSFLETTLVYMDVYPLFMNGPRTVISPDTQLERFYRLTRELAHNY